MSLLRTPAIFLVMTEARMQRQDCLLMPARSLCACLDLVASRLGGLDLEALLQH